MFGSSGRGFGGFAARGQQQSGQFPFGNPSQGGAASNPFQPSNAAAPVFGAPSPGFGPQASSSAPSGFGAQPPSGQRSRGKPSTLGAQTLPAPSSRSGPAFGTRSQTSTTFGGAGSGAGAHTTFGSASSGGGGAHTAFGSVSARATFGDAQPKLQVPPAGGNPFASSGGNAGSAGAASFGGNNAAFSGGRQKPPAVFGDSAAAAPGVHTTFGSGASAGKQRRGNRSRPGAPPTAPPPFGGDSGSANPFQPSQPNASGPLPPDVGGARQSPGLQPHTTFGSARSAHAPRAKQVDAPFGGGDLPDGVHQASNNPFHAGGATNVAFGEKSNKRTQGKRQSPAHVDQEQSSNGQPKRNALGGMATADWTPAQPSQARPARSPPSTPAFNPSSVPTASTTAATATLEKAELASATNLDGLCIDMCSPAERELHIRVDELSVFEKCYPDQPGKEREMIIKRFQRSSADHKLDIPEEIRPPGVLRQTQLYIEERIMDLERDGDDPRFNPPRTPELIELYNFCWDRFRMIRKDFVLQNYRGAGGRVHPIVLDVHERIARYHVLSEHELCEVTSFVAQQNMEQLGQTLKSLNELYDESRNLGDPRCLSPFEAECRAYFILCTLDNGRGLDVLKFVKGLPQSIMESSHVKFAMRVFVARHTGDYHKFFSLLKEATYLQACLLFRYIVSMRSQALQRMNRGYRTQSYPLADLVDLLCFEDLEHAASVCQQHGLKIQKKADVENGKYFVVRFGGEFESDIQLRRNKTPLATRASWRYIGVKQGNYLRRDVCRGVTEYEEYPALSSLIRAYEDEERARLYPSRPRYVDDYSFFVDFATAPPPKLAEQTQRLSSDAWQQHLAPPNAHANGNYEDHSWGMEPEPDEQGKAHELELIAQRKAQLLKKQQEALERIRELQRAKEERQRLEREKNEEEERREAETRDKLEALAKEKADKQAELRRQQDELAQRVREAEQQRLLKLKQQKEDEERRRRAEEAARIKREQEADERRRLEAMRAKAAEEERRRQEAIRIEEARRREEAERERQRQIVAENARRKREAELEAKRQAQLARELAEKKRLRRIKKQKLAILQFRFSLWKNYVRACRHPSGPAVVRLPTAYETPLSSHLGPKEKVDWLFEHKSGVSIPAGLISKKRTQDASSKRSLDGQDGELMDPVLLPTMDVLRVVSPALRSRHPNASVIPWKLLIADLQSGSAAAATTPSFGQWCAARAGIAAFTGSASDAVGLRDTLRIYETSSDVEEAHGVLACCRYVDSSSLNGVHDASQPFTAVSAVLVPIELTWIQDRQSYQLWDSAFEQVIAALPATSRTALVILAGANAGIRKTAVAPLLEAIEQTVRRIQSSFASRVATVCFHLMVDEDDTHPSRLYASMIRRFEQVLADAACNSPLQPQLVEIGLKDVLEGTLHTLKARENGATPVKSGKQLQAQVCDAMAQIYQEIFSDEVMTRDFPPPELERVLPEPPVGWNSHEKQTHLSNVLRTLASVRVEFAALDKRAQTLAPDQVCDFFFKAVVDFVDRLFQSSTGAESEVSLFELKKWLFAELLPIHERLTRVKAPAISGEASRLIPWRKVFLMVYGAYIEALRDGVKRAESSTTPRPVVVSVKHLKGALGGRIPSIALSLPAKKTTKRDCAQSGARRARTTTRELQKLRHDLDREKAASTQFQRMLRHEVKRWSADGALP